MKAERGMAMLELAVMFLLAFIFLILGISVSEYVSLTSSVDRVVDKVVYDDGFIPYRAVNTSSGPQLVLRQADLQAHIQQNIIQRLSTELQALNAGITFDVGASYVEVDVDAQQGSAQRGENTEHFSGEQSSVSHDIVQDAYEASEEQISGIIASTRHDVDGREIFAHASPTAGYSIAGSRFKFFPRKLLIGVWVAVDVQDSFWIKLGQGFFNESFIKRTKTIVLRGEATV